jgi:hypothetical protein
LIGLAGIGKLTHYPTDGQGGPEGEAKLARKHVRRQSRLAMSDQVNSGVLGRIKLQFRASAEAAPQVSAAL